MRVERHATRQAMQQLAACLSAIPSPGWQPAQRRPMRRNHGRAVRDSRVARVTSGSRRMRSPASDERLTPQLLITPTHASRRRVSMAHASRRRVSMAHASRLRVSMAHASRLRVSMAHASRRRVSSRGTGHGRAAVSPVTPPCLHASTASSLICFKLHGRGRPDSLHRLPSPRSLIDHVAHR